MRTSFKIKFYQYLLQQSNHQGITLVETLCVLIVLGIMVVLAKPDNIGIRQKIVLSEAKTYVTAMNRGQQRYFIDNKGKFASSLPQLELGIKEQTENYHYSTVVKNNAVFNYAKARKEYVESGWFDRKPILNFVGAVFPRPNAKDQENQTVDILCITEKHENFLPSDPTFINGILECGKGTKLAY